MAILFAHGLEGSPDGRKVEALRNAGLEVEAPDFRGMKLMDRVALLEENTRDRRILLGGSSYGGLAACFMAGFYPERFTGLLLCAPALNLSEDPVPDPQALVIPPSIPTIVIHALGDEVVPVAVSRALRRRSGDHVDLREVTDDHRLAASLPFIVEAARELGA
jgi:pimeloyl-ACP methyl ester carboxylesterase